MASAIVAASNLKESGLAPLTGARQPGIVCGAGNGVSRRIRRGGVRGCAPAVASGCRCELGDAVVFFCARSAASGRALCSINSNSSIQTALVPRDGGDALSSPQVRLASRYRRRPSRLMTASASISNTGETPAESLSAQRPADASTSDASTSDASSSISLSLEERARHFLRTGQFITAVDPALADDKQGQEPSTQSAPLAANDSGEEVDRAPSAGLDTEMTTPALQQAEEELSEDDAEDFTLSVDAVLKEELRARFEGLPLDELIGIEGMPDDLDELDDETDGEEEEAGVYLNGFDGGDAFGLEVATAGAEDGEEDEDEDDDDDELAMAKSEHLRDLLEARKREEEEVLAATDRADAIAKELERVSVLLSQREDELCTLTQALQQAQVELEVIKTSALQQLEEARSRLAEKDRQITLVETALAQLHTVRVEWFGAAKQVLLAGAFDGWSHYIEMEPEDPLPGRAEKMFVAELLLYPGCYEVKFIVDGNWVTDRRMEVVQSGGHENNLLRVV